MKTPPQIKLKKLEPAIGTFIKNKSAKFAIQYPDGTEKSMVLDYIERKRPDASVILAYTKDNKLWLRSAIRTACAVRSLQEPDFGFSGNFWELPAGLVDEGETAQQAASRECLEEIGFNMDFTDFKYIHMCMSMPSLVAERLYFYSVLVDNEEQVEPTLDGSPLEHMGELICVPIEELMDMVNRGEIIDMKTNLGIRIIYDKLFRTNKN